MPIPIAPLEITNQMQDNLTWTNGDHVAKFGFGFNHIADTRRSNSFVRYTFASIANYVSAKTGANPFAYTRFDQIFGDTNIEFKSTFYNFFAQDDWKITRKLKLNYGVRYDLYNIPKADPTAVYEPSRKFKVDKNNFAPRLGLVYGIRDGNRPTVIRASAGIYYDTVYLDTYQRASQGNGSPKSFTVSFTNPALPGAPGFPNNVSTGTPPRQNITGIASDFENMYAIHGNVQVEQALTQDLSVTVGYIHSSGRHIPIYRSVNRINPVGALADGRPIYSDTVSAATRMDPRFNDILLAEASGNSNYNAFTAQLNKRFSKGYQFSANYTLSKSMDDAPEQNLVATQAGGLVQQDPTNHRRDYGPSLADQRHTFVLSFVGRPDFHFENKAWNYLLNNNQFGIIATANSGERFNIIAATDINKDGFNGTDNPVGITRNSGTTPKQVNVDFRYSRFIPFTERLRLEVFGEFVNVFNINSIYQINSLTVTTDALGNATGPLPSTTNRPVTSLDARQFQIGLKFRF